MKTHLITYLFNYYLSTTNSISAKKYRVTKPPIVSWTLTQTHHLVPRKVHQAEKCCRWMSKRSVEMMRQVSGTTQEPLCSFIKIALIQHILLHLRFESSFRALCPLETRVFGPVQPTGTWSGSTNRQSFLLPSLITACSFSSPSLLFFQPSFHFERDQTLDAWQVSRWPLLDLSWNRFRVRSTDNVWSIAPLATSSWKILLEIDGINQSRGSVPIHFRPVPSLSVIRLLVWRINLPPSFLSVSFQLLFLLTHFSDARYCLDLIKATRSI